MLDACRTTHESFSTFASITLLVSEGNPAPDLLRPYPDYVPLYEALEAATATVDGPNRKYLLATQAARVSMQSQVLSLFVSEDLKELRPSSLRRIDTPDGRWDWILCQHPTWWAHVAKSADEAVRARHGSSALDLDQPSTDALAAVAPEHDPAWAEWEQAAYRQIAAGLATQSASVLEFNGHQNYTAAALEKAVAINPDLGLKAASRLSPSRDDRALASAVTEQARHFFGPASRWSARIDETPIQSIVTIIKANSRIAGRPALVVSTRLPSRLRALYDWADEDDATLESIRKPVVAVRSIEGGDPTDVIVHHRLDSPEQLRQLRDAFAVEGTFSCCVAASCLIDLDWQKRWLGAMRGAGPLAVLIDIELDRFVSNWVRASTSLRLSIIEINDTAGPRQAVAISPDRETIWIAVADQLGANMLARQLLDTPNAKIESDASSLEDWGETLVPLLTHLLATESYFDLMGLDGTL